MLDEEIKIEDKIEELLRMTADKRYRELKLQLVEMNEVDIASFIEELDSEKTVVVFRMMPKELATEVLPVCPLKSSSILLQVLQTMSFAASLTICMWMMRWICWRNFRPAL